MGDTLYHLSPFDFGHLLVVAFSGGFQTTVVFIMEFPRPESGSLGVVAPGSSMMDDDMMMDMEARAQTPLPAAAMAATTSTHPSAAAAAQALDADDATNPGANPFHGQLGEPTNPEAFPVDTEPAFPAGLRVLLVDDDPICLMIVEKMLKRCDYQVTTCKSGETALEMLRANKEDPPFDIVLTDVNMPGIDGFLLLQQIGLELDVPVIMMSGNGETNVVLKGITHGAVDYLLKPVRPEECSNIWQHVVRRKKDVLNKALSGPLPDGGPAEYADTLGKHHRTDDDNSVGDTMESAGKDRSSKKPRVVWSQELHQKFVNAVNELGIDKAVPKRILDLMEVPGLTRENVASHLQKYRLFLKRLAKEGMLPSPSGFFEAMGGQQQPHPQQMAPMTMAAPQAPMGMAPQAPGQPFGAAQGFGGVPVPAGAAGMPNGAPMHFVAPGATAPQPTSANMQAPGVYGGYPQGYMAGAPSSAQMQPGMASKGHGGVPPHMQQMMQQQTHQQQQQQQQQHHVLYAQAGQQQAMQQSEMVMNVGMGGTTMGDHQTPAPSTNHVFPEGSADAAFLGFLEDI